MEKVALINLGCAKNLVDSEVMLGYLNQQDYEITADSEEADIIIINTCGFIKEARKESESVIKEAIEAKDRFQGEKKVVVAGCYVERCLSELEHKFPEVDYWTGVKDLNHIVDIITNTPYQKSDKCYLYDHLSPRYLSTPPSWAYVKISEGCSHTCSFCAIPLIKGPYQSRSVSSIVNETKRLADKGIKEINIISQDSTYYGKDLGLKNGLTLLIEELIKIKKIKWIRVLYAYPEEIHDSLLDIFKEHKICSYLDCPFQHSNREILNKMRRGMHGSQALRLIAKIRKKVPDIALRTTLIVGFPGESKEKYEELKNFVQAAKFDHLGVFTYSREKNTECYALGDPVSYETKIGRQRELLDIQSHISAHKNRQYLDRIMEVIVEGRLTQDPTLLMGRTKYQAPEVDGMVYIDTKKDQKDYSGRIEKFKITGSDAYDLYGEFIT
ncbi:MAG: 30S ribosomal protein S12 methylthiotransferase RimO [Acidobacteriota bacterium]